MQPSTGLQSDPAGEMFESVARLTAEGDWGTATDDADESDIHVAPAHSEYQLRMSSAVMPPPAGMSGSVAMPITLGARWSVPSGMRTVHLVPCEPSEDSSAVRLSISRVPWWISASFYSKQQVETRFALPL
jgi:hypothetical protein